MTADTFYNLKVCPFCGGRKMASSVGCKKCHTWWMKTRSWVNQITSRMFPLEWVEYD